MSATSVKQIKSNDDTKEVKPLHQINPSYTVRVLCCVLFIFLTELCLAHYIYRLINAEISQNYVDKNEFKRYFISELRSSVTRQEILDVVRDFDRNVKEGLGHGNRKKRGALVLDDNAVNSPGDGPNVEFFNPKLKHELEAKDAAEKQRSGHKGAAPGGDSWVWLTSYSRIPLVAIQGFCSATREYCPPGRQGSTGTSGSKGERGDPGLPGIPGPIGPRGPHGFPGEKGLPGRSGLDGRDGVPGEPGLDGVPGRSGLDGIPGIDGMPGNDGRSGRDGINGTDGRPGLTGPQGPPGPQGPRGMTGPRGRTGKPGNHGTPGIPGINAWNMKVNDTNELLVPPSIAGTTLGIPRGPIVVHEGENVRLRCAATGIPRPQVEWRRMDVHPVSMGSWQASSVQGHTLNITHVNRVHMGTYQCIADNGIPPQTNQTFQLEVHFPPLIRIRNQMVGAANGTTAVLECEVEAFPEAVRYWERSDGRLLEDGDKYRIDNSAEKDGYKATMQLNITRVNIHDFTLYHCISKNERGITKGVFTLYEVDPRLATPPPIVDGGSVAVYGVQPPEKVSLDDLCPPPVTCPECPDPKDFKCRDSGISLFDLVRRLEVRPFGNTTYPGLPNRQSDCVLYAVGKPVYHRFTDQTYGSWMRDASPPSEAAAEKFWVTRENDPYQLLEFANKAVFRKDTPSRKYNIELPFKGNSHVVYNGSFFYHKRDYPTILKFDLATERHHSLEVPMVSTNGSNYLYTTEYNYMDFSVDDNGLWIIYGLSISNNTIVMKVDSNTMQTQYIWNISINHHSFGEMFIVCGVLYGVDSVTERNTKIRLALDLYKNVLLDVNLVFTNPFRRTTMLGYNHRNKELYTWDKGNQLTYPVRYHEIGYNLNSTKEEKQEHGDGANAQMQTGFDIYQ